MYAEISSQKALKQFRKDWTERKLQDLVVSKEHSVSWRRIDTTKGNYYTMERIAVEFGAAADKGKAMKAATEHCCKCEELGGQWSSGDTFATHRLYLFLQYQFAEELRQSWTLYETYTEQIKDASSSREGPEAERDANLKYVFIFSLVVFKFNIFDF